VKNGSDIACDAATVPASAPRKKAAAGFDVEASVLPAGVAEAALELELQPEANAIEAEAVDARRAIVTKSDWGFEWFMKS
jgi:hypothetical protein